MTQHHTASDLKQRNKRLLLNLLCVVIGMAGLAYGSVPLYDLFCRVTGFGGTTVRADVTPQHIIDREFTVRFSSNVSPELPWRFEPEQSKVKVKAGENKLVYYWAINESDQPVIGTSIYNVMPFKAGPYFNKIECFCFEEQVVQPGEKILFPVSFFVDPDIINNNNLDDISTITLSYTFFEAKNPTTQLSSVGETYYGQ